MKALRRLALLLAALLALPWAAFAGDEYWDAYDRPVVCCEDRTGCEVLQMVMMGSFAALQPTDSLTVRVMSAALPALCDVTDADFSHFCEEFSVDEGTVRRLYYVAIANCLWADMLISPDAGGAAGRGAGGCCCSSSTRTARKRRGADGDHPRGHGRNADRAHVRRDRPARGLHRLSDVGK